MRFKKQLPSIYGQFLLKAIVEMKKQLGNNLVSVIVYGSVARGDFNKNSDIDMLIVCKELPKERLKRQELFSNVEKRFEENYELLRKKGYFGIIIPILKTTEEADSISPLYLDMVEDAVLLYDKDDFFKTILIRLSQGLKGINARRVWIGKKWYWDLMPNYKSGDVVSIE